MVIPQCFFHPDYAGKTVPKLSCKMCCEIFILVLKLSQQERGNHDRLGNLLAHATGADG